MPFGKTVSTGRGSFTFRMSRETGARLSRSTLLVGVDLSCAESPWLNPIAGKATARTMAAAVCNAQPNLFLELIDSSSSFITSQDWAGVAQRLFAVRFLPSPIRHRLAIQSTKPRGKSADATLPEQPALLAPSARQFFPSRPDTGAPRAGYRPGLPRCISKGWY